MLPSQFAWLASFASSISAATSTVVTATCEKTINPLVFRVKVSLGEPTKPKQMMLIWNLFQMFVAKNDGFVQGKAAMNGRSLTVEVGVKHRLGPPKNKHPVG